MENKAIKWNIDQIKSNLETMAKHVSSLFGDVMWDTDKELKTSPDYYKGEMCKEILEAWKQIERLKGSIEEISQDYSYASREPKPEEPEEDEIN